MKNLRSFFSSRLPAHFCALLAIVSICVLFELRGFAQDTTKTTVADTKYGQGGTVETISDKKLKVLKEIWRDADGKVREVYTNLGGPSGETWEFYSESQPWPGHPTFDFSLKPDDDRVKDDDRPTYEMTYGTPDKIFDRARGELKDEYLKVIEAVEKQFARDDEFPQDPLAIKNRGVATGSTTSAAAPNDPCAEGSPSTTAEQRVSVAVATARIKCYIALIEKQKKYMADTYYDVGAKTTLETAFKAQGITSSMSYSDSWGKSGIGLTWSESAKKFYDNHLEFLNKSLEAITKRGYATGKEMAYFGNGMRSWKSFDLNIAFQFKAFVAAFTEEAKVNDEKVAAYNKFAADYSRAANARPFNAANVNEVNAQFGRTSKPLDDKIKQIEQHETEIGTNIATLAGIYMFSALKPDK